MKKSKLLTALLIALTISLPNLVMAQADDDKACQLILQDGLYKQYKILRTGNFQKDLKEYFSSDKFTKDFHEGNWAGKIAVVYDGVPIELGANSSNKDLSEFQEHIRKSKELTINQSFYDYSSTSIPDVELAKVYSDCVIGNRRYGFKVTPRIGEKDVFFVVNYYKFPSEKDGMPKIKLFDLKGGGNVVKSFKIGDDIDAETIISADRDPEKDLTLIIETDRGVAAYKVPAEPSGFNKDFPVGTIICSYLNWTEFQAATKNNSNNTGGGSIWISRYSKWAPADGRQVPNSSFQKITSQNNIPDLRGQFLRGLNQFDGDQSSQVDPAKKDPDNRTRGSFQKDEFKTHDHDLPDNITLFNEPGGDKRISGGTPVFNINNNTLRTSTAGESTETRPKNIAIFYYIRIN